MSDTYFDIINRYIKENKSIEEIILFLREQNVSEIEIMSLLKKLLNISSEKAQEIVLNDKKKWSNDFFMDLFLDSDSEE